MTEPNGVPTKDPKRKGSTVPTLSLAERLWSARRDGFIIDVPNSEVPADEAASYALQTAAVAASGDERLGWKVGSTSREAQALLDTSWPGSAPLLAAWCFETGDNIRIFKVHEPALEGEFAMLFAADLPPRERPYSMAEVLDAIEAVAPGLEVVGSRRVGGLLGQGRMLVNADFGTNVAFAKGEWQSKRRFADLATDLIEHPIALYRNDNLIEQGTGARSLGNPAHAAVWLANHLNERGLGIRAGEYVTTGTCTGLKPVVAWDRVKVDCGDLGALEVEFERA